jgi:ABC-type lipoprotein release transport system permease subunit
MFNLKWAFKNLIANKRRTGGIIIFLTLILTLMIVNLLFLDGTNTQMKVSLRNNKGDLYLWFWPGNNPNPVSRYLERYDTKLENKIKFLTPNAGTLNPDMRKYSQIFSSTGYAEGWVLGTEPNYLKFLDRDVSWPVKYRANLKAGTALIENGLAQKLNVKRGDYITIKIKTDAGMINTLQVMVDGIFVGSNLLFGDVIYINLKDQNLLLLTGNVANYNEMRLYFKPTVTDKDLQTILRDIMGNFSMYITCPRLNPTREPVFVTFKYYRYLLILLFTLLNAVFIMILYFAIQNILFMTFRQRREELSTLLTYGMKPFRIQWIGLWEANLMFGAALILSIPFSMLITQFIHKFEITDSSLAELIIVIGGPRICFSLNWVTIPALIVGLWVITLISSHKGTHSYLKMEIREITSKV